MLRVSIPGRKGDFLTEIGLVNGGTRSVGLDRDITLYVDENYLIHDSMYRVKYIKGNTVFIVSI